MADFRIGIDEAGRGPVLGPLVVGIVLWDPVLEEKAPPIGDSKKLSPKKRKEAREFIHNNCEYLLLSLPAWLISRSKYPLQILEARAITQALEYFPEAPPVFCDALGSGQKAHQWIQWAHPQRKIKFEPSADDRYPAASAASIMAKTCRDQCIENIKKEWGDVGSGYPSDPATRKWLQKNNNGKDWPPVVRTSWSTIRNLQ